MKDKIFSDADGEQVKYDGSPLSWRVSAYALIYRKDQIFLVKHTHEKNYDLPGGGIRLTESITKGLKREVREEAGLNISIGQLASYHQDYFYHRQEKKFYKTLLLFFNCKIVGKRSKPTDNRIKFSDYVLIKKINQYPLLEYVKKQILGNQ